MQAKEPKMSYVPRGQAGADYFGKTVFKAAIAQWIAIENDGLNPAIYMDSDHFLMAREHMLFRLNRMWDAMLTVFPHLADSLVSRYDFRHLKHSFIEMLFALLKNRVWSMIKDQKGLTQMRFRLEEYVDLLDDI